MNFGCRSDMFVADEYKQQAEFQDFRHFWKFLLQIFLESFFELHESGFR